MEKIGTALLVTVVCATALMVVGAVVFSNRAQDQVQHAQELKSALQACEGNLSEAALLQAQAQQDADVSMESVRKYDQLYARKSLEAEQRAEEVNATRKQVQQLRVQLVAEQQHAVALQATITQKEAAISSLQEEVKDWKRRYLTVQSALDSCSPS